MNHRTLVRIHGYIAVFFLPLALLYAVTGTLYIIGESGSANTVSVEFQTTTGWPETIDAAYPLVEEKLRENDLPMAINGVTATSRVNSDREYYWRTLAHSATLTRTGDAAAALRIQKNGPYRQLVEIHKDHAGILFTILGFGFGIAMAILILSGAVMMFRSKLYRKPATLLLSSGTVLCLTAYGVSVFA